MNQNGFQRNWTTSDSDNFLNFRTSLSQKPQYDLFVDFSNSTISGSGDFKNNSTSSRLFALWSTSVGKLVVITLVRKWKVRLKIPSFGRFVLVTWDEKVKMSTIHFFNYRIAPFEEGMRGEKKKQKKTNTHTHHHKHRSSLYLFFLTIDISWSTFIGILFLGFVFPKSLISPLELFLC